MAACLRTIKWLSQISNELDLNPKLNGNAFNFGPNSNQNYTVTDVVKELSKIGKVFLGKRSKKK